MTSISGQILQWQRANIEIQDYAQIKLVIDRIQLEIFECQQK